jgi:undecaprenyl diphosphate synthase
MTLLLKTISIEVRELHKQNVRFTAIGNLEMLPQSTQNGINDGIEITKNNTGLNLCLALNYGSRQEMVSAVQTIAKKVKNGELAVEKIDETIFSHTLSTASMPDPDLLIRTGGEYRLSNFLLWQSAYTEIYMTNTYWPKFRETSLMEAILDFQSRERRFGKVSDQIAHSK